ncbi:MAG: RuvX/YqgF family protein [Patescibacteria group bacterium]
MKKLLGIDYGSKRVGVAISDENNQFGLPLTVIQNTFAASSDLAHEIQKLAKGYDINEIVLGESKNYKGEDNTIMAKSLELKKEMEGCGYLVHFEPEFMTSANAERFQGKNDMSDASAAALILQSFLDKRRNSA